VANVRGEIAAEGITPLASGPAVSDELFELGQALFFDKLVSGNQDVSCATCHLPPFGGTDGRTLPNGVGGSGQGPARFGGDIIPRNGPSVVNAHLLGEMFWDGRVEPGGGGSLNTPAGAALTPAMQAVFDPGLELLAAQAMMPPTSREEMRGQIGESELGNLPDGEFTDVWQGIMDRILVVPEYVTLFSSAYPTTPLVDFNFAHAANAIAGFEARAFDRTDSPFERFVGGDDTALTTPQLQGALEFFRPGNCSSCHSGNLFTDEDYHNIALPQFGPGQGNGPGGDDDFGRENVTGNGADRYRFRTPSLLNVELTAPYGHVGQFADLTDFVAHYRNTQNSLLTYNIVAEVDDPSLIATLVPNANQVLNTVDPLVANPRNFNANQIADFLRALTADSARDLSDVVPATVPSGLPVN
jgi:cytochrome c peroxidase